jgi:hypothetical protein
VLGTPPAFVLSQDQTLQLNSEFLNWRAQSALRFRAMFRENSPRKSAVNALKKFDCGFRNLSWTCYLVFKDQAGRNCRPISIRALKGAEAYM